MNDTLSAVGDREFWTAFVSAYWTPDTTLALRVKMEEDLCWDITLPLLSHFLSTWASSCGMTKLHFGVTQITEGVMPSGLPFLSSPMMTMETNMLEGSLLVKQHGRIYVIFDLGGRITLLEWHLTHHDEYFLSGKAGTLVAANYGADKSCVCKLGFPAGVWRMMEMVEVLRKMWDGGTEGDVRKRRKKITTTTTLEQ
jgi:hypothetical protein